MQLFKNANDAHLLVPNLANHFSFENNKTFFDAPKPDSEQIILDLYWIINHATIIGIGNMDHL